MRIRRSPVIASQLRYAYWAYGAQLFEQTDVLVIDIGGPRTAIPSAKPAAIFAVASKLLTRHKPEFL
jgi:hypothetical protein